MIKNINNLISDCFQGFLALSLLMVAMNGCTRFVEVDLPDSQLTQELVFNDVETAEAAITSIYSKLTATVLTTGSSNGISILLGAYADELEVFNTNIPEMQFYQNTLVPTGIPVVQTWNGSYNLIYAANAVKEGVQQSTTLSTGDKSRLVGEALFVRAFIHFYLANLFGEIPYVTTTDYRVNAVIGKSTEAAVYAALVADLEEAEFLLSASASYPMRIRPGVDAIRAVLARVHLFHGDWTASELAATEVIQSANFAWVDNLDDVFLKQSTGTIWQLMPSQEGLPTLQGQNFIFTSGPPPNRALSQHVLDAFESGDLRKDRWVGRVEETTGVWYHPYKYKQHLSESTSREYSILLRLAEQYLIRAEARAHLGNLEGAKSDVNRIRQRAGLRDTEAETAEELLAAILQERRVELFSELGHRFLDLKRTGLLHTTLEAIKPGWDETDARWPLPESELLLNPNLLPQNDGY